jgi:periplasmic protein TonB
VAAAIFLPGARGGRRRALLASVAALLSYAALATWANVSASAPSPSSVPPLPTMEVEMLAPPPPPPPPPPPEQPPPPPPRAAVPRVHNPPPTPAQAAQVVTREAAADPLDLTAFTVASGTAAHHAGGTTAGNGTSTRAVNGPASAAGVADGTGDLSRSVQLADDEWECPWPPQADALGIDRQTVVLRVTVAADGAVEAASLISDPGDGFGAAALVCARRSRFLPALDGQGRAVPARSGPIRVLFTR